MNAARALFLVLVTLTTAGGAFAATPVTQTEALVNALKAVKVKPKGNTAPLSEADRQANTTAFRALDAFFDFDRITGDAIGPHKASLSAQQLKTFLADFREVIRLVAYPRSGNALSKAKYKVRAGATRADKHEGDAEMTIRFEDEDSDTKVTFHWSENGGAWKLYDLSFDSASMVKDYQNQFGRIIEKEKAKGLMKKLAKKLQDERKENVVAP